MTESDARTRVDLAGIPDSEVCCRRLSDAGQAMMATDSVTGTQRPSSGAFMPDGDGVSVYRETLLRQAGLTPADLVRGAGNLVVGLPVGEIREIARLEVADDPWPADADDPEHPRNGAHALIVGWAGLSKNERIRRQRALSRLPGLSYLYPDQ